MTYLTANPGYQAEGLDYIQSVMDSACLLFLKTVVFFRLCSKKNSQEKHEHSGNRVMNEEVWEEALKIPYINVSLQ